MSDFTIFCSIILAVQFYVGYMCIDLIKAANRTTEISHLFFVYIFICIYILVMALVSSSLYLGKPFNPFDF